MWDDLQTPPCGFLASRHTIHRRDKYTAGVLSGFLAGIGISGATWATTFLFRLRPEHISTAINAFVDFTSAAAYGLGLALLYRVFKRRE